MLVPTLYLTAFVWENLLIQQPAVTRYVLFGALLIALMTIRPAGPLRDREGGDRLMAARLLELKGVSKAFGGLQVISDLDFHVDEHEIVSVIGPNGAGKTTLFNLVTGVYELDEGEILLRGRADRRPRALQDHRKGIARTFQTLRLFLNMTVKENVMAAAYGHTKAGVVRSVLRTPGMRREEKEIAALAEEKLALLRPAADGLPLEPARVLALVREPSPPRDRARDGDERAPAPARRAGRRDEPCRRRTRSPS